MVEPDRLILEHLRGIRGEIGRLAAEVVTMRVETMAMRQHMTAIMTIQKLDHTDIASIKICLNRIEKRLDLVH